MKLILFACLFCFFNKLSSQVIQVNYDCKNFSAKNFSSYIDQMPLTERVAMVSGLNGVITHYSIQSDGNQIIRSLDSLTQICNIGEVSKFPYNQILMVRDNGWDKYLKLVEPSHTKIYKIVEEKEKDAWKVDYSSTKNILGFKCFYAKNESNDQEWAWFTLDIPITATPVAKFPFKGVVLEFQDESLFYVANNIRLNNELKQLDSFDENNYDVVNLRSFREFSNIVMNNSTKISTSMFQCRKL